MDVVKTYLTQEIKTHKDKTQNSKTLQLKLTRFGIEYRSVRNLVKSKICKARDSFHKRQLELNSSDCKGL